jgi:RNA polymerase sigma-70 factor (ECF subfamily)
MPSQEAFLKLFLRHQAEIKAFVLSLTRDRNLCDDLVQETALVMWQKFQTFDAARSFGAWGRGIAFNKVRQHWDKTRSRPVLMSDNVIQAVTAAYDETENETVPEKEALQKCLDRLQERSRDLIGMRYEQSLSLQAIADRISSTLDAVNKQLSRLRKALSECIQKQLAGTNDG